MRKIFLHHENIFFIFLILFILAASSLLLSISNQKTPETKSKAQTNCIFPTGGRTRVTTSGSLCSGDFSSGLEIASNDIQLDCAGQIIDGSGKSGETGIMVNSKNNFALRNCKVKGFFIGVGASGGSNITIENGDFSGNSIGSPVSISPGSESSPVENLGDQNQNTGAGIQFDGVNDSKILNSTARNSVAGIILTNSSNIQISGGNYSNNSGWGIKLKSSSNNTINNVIANGNDRWCVNDGITHRGCESAAILLIDESNNNNIIGNQLNDSGDGFYINGNGHTPSNNNTVAYNTANNAVNGNSIETTFSSGNKFIGNKVAGSNYGLWLGYSDHSYVLNNIASAKAGAINIDHSVCNIIVNNKLDSGEPENNKIGSDSSGCHDNMLSANSPEIPTQNCENTTTNSPPCSMEYPISLPQQLERPTSIPQPTVFPVTKQPKPTNYLKPTSILPPPTQIIVNQPTTPLQPTVSVPSPSAIYNPPTTYNVQPTTSPPTSAPTAAPFFDIGKTVKLTTVIWNNLVSSLEKFTRVILP